MAKHRTAQSLSHQNDVPQPLARGCVGLIGLLFFAAGMFFWWITSIGPLIASLRCGDWVEVPCEIVGSEIRHGHRNSVRPEIEFTYEFESLEYTSDTYDFTTLNRIYPRCREIVDSQPVGKQTSCYVNPRDPTRAVIVRDFDFSILAFLFPLIFVVVGGAIIGFVAFLKEAKSRQKGFLRTRSKDVSSIGKTAVAYSPKDPMCIRASDRRDEQMEGPQNLKPEFPRKARFVGGLILTLFWNGSICTAIAVGLSDGRTGLGDKMEFAPALILFVLACVGLFFLVKTIEAFLGLYNPHVELALSTGTATRGKPVKLAWKLSGNRSSVKSLVIRAEAEEFGAITSEKSSKYIRHVIETIPIDEVIKSGEMESGQSVFTIPCDVMHTFEAGGSSVSWRIVVEAEVLNWPDIEERFEFRVQP